MDRWFLLEVLRGNPAHASPPASGAAGRAQCSWAAAFASVFHVDFPVTVCPFLSLVRTLVGSRAHPNPVISS